MTTADGVSGEAPVVAEPADTSETLCALLRELRTSELGLSGREAQRRLIVYGPNEITTTSGRRWPGELRKQVAHPLALVLVVAAALAWWTGTPVLAAAIIAVIVLNAGFAFVQEFQAERAVEALAAYLPVRAHVLRDHQIVEIEARTLVPGDVMVISEGDRVCADGRIIDGEVCWRLTSWTEPISARQQRFAAGPTSSVTSWVPSQTFESNPSS